jgi:hypothetical protein
MKYEQKYVGVTFSKWKEYTMKSRMLKFEQMNPKHALRFVFLLFVLIVLLSFSPTSVWAQDPPPEIEPQKVTAIYEGTCGEQDFQPTLEVWNVGAAGGDEYAQAVLTSLTCIDDVDEPYVQVNEPLYGTFSGGPNGVAKIRGYMNVDFQFVDGTRVEVVGFDYVMIVQNPEAFPATTQDCEAKIGLPSELKPGDDIWLSASYTNLDGAPIAPEKIISEAWIINGKAGVRLTTWDGKAMNIELQYTCPDGNAHTKNYDLPAYQEGIAPAPAPDVDVPPEEPEQVSPENKITQSPLLPIVIILGILAIGGGALVGTGVVIYGVGKATGIIGGKPQKPAAPSVTRTPPQKPVAPKPVAKPTPHVSPSSPEPVKNIHTDSPKPLTEAEISNLKRRKTEMEQTIEEYKLEWQETREKLQKLQRLHKNNLIKRMLQLGLETEDIVSVKNPVDLVTKILSEPVEDAMGKPSPEKETAILLATDKLIHSMEGKLEGLQGSVKYLRTEIRNINKKLAG